MLDLAFVDLAHRCAPQIQLELLAAVVSVQSEFEPLMIRVAGREAPRSKGVGEAVANAIEHIDQGKAVQLGLSGLEARELGALGIAMNDAFDGCKSLGALASVLQVGAVVAAKAGVEGAAVEQAMVLHLVKVTTVAGDQFTFARRVKEARQALAPTIAALAAQFSKRRPARAPELLAATSELAAPKLKPVATAAAETVTPRVAPAWDVYASGRGAGVLVFSKQAKKDTQ